jgi:hypothetical protein
MIRPYEGSITGTAEGELVSVAPLLTAATTGEDSIGAPQ